MSQIESLTLLQIMQRFPDADAAREHLERLRWPEGPACPRCGGAEVYRLTAKADSKSGCRKGLLKCKYCRRQFTVTVGTIFEDSHIPLNKWLIAIYMLCSSKKGISAHQIHRMLKLSYKSAWFMMHRIRFAMEAGPIREKLFGVIEADETYVGGKRSRRQVPPNKKSHRGRPAPDSPMRPVFALVQRDGDVRSFHVHRVTSENLKAILQTNVDENSALVTDDLNVYGPACEDFGSHETINHSKGEYSRRGNVHTNTIEGYFSILKRGINGVYHHVGAHHLHRYLSEFDFRYNSRKVNDGARTEMAVRGFEGKRLTYRDSSKRRGTASR